MTVPTVSVTIDRQTAADCVQIIAMCIEADRRSEFMNGDSIDCLTALSEALSRAIERKP